MIAKDLKDWEYTLSLFRVEKAGTLSREEVQAIRDVAKERATPVSCRAFLAVLSSHQRLLEEVTNVMGKA